METESQPLYVSNSSNEISSKIKVSINNKILSGKQTLQDTRIFRDPNDPNYSNDMTLQGYDILLENDGGNVNDGVSLLDTPPAIVLSTVIFINTYSNETFVANRVGNAELVKKESS